MVDIKHEINNKHFFKILFIASIFALFIGYLILLIILASDQITDIKQSFIVTKISGRIILKRGDNDLTEVKKQMILEQNDIIETDNNSDIDISLGNGDAVRIKQNSSVKLDSKSNLKPIELHLLYGEVLSKIISVKKKFEIYRIRTETFTVGVRGTSFILSYRPPYTLLSVKDGRVELTDNLGKSIEIEEGYKLELSGDQPHILKELSEEDKIKLNEIEDIKTALTKSELKEIFISKTKNDINNEKDTSTGEDERGTKRTSPEMIEKDNQEEIQEALTKEEIEYTLTVSITPSPSGELKAGTVQISGDNCTSVCTKNYGSGSVVKLVAIPDDSFIFEGWYSSDSLIDKSDSLEIEMDSNKTIMAVFMVNIQ